MGSVLSFGFRVLSLPTMRGAEGARKCAELRESALRFRTVSESFRRKMLESNGTVFEK